MQGSSGAGKGSGRWTCVRCATLNSSSLDTCAAPGCHQTRAGGGGAAAAHQHGRHDARRAALRRKLDAALARVAPPIEERWPSGIPPVLVSRATPATAEPPAAAAEAAGAATAAARARGPGGGGAGPKVRETARAPAAPLASWSRQPHQAVPPGQPPGPPPGPPPPPRAAAEPQVGGAAQGWAEPPGCRGRPAQSGSYAAPGLGGEPPGCRGAAPLERARSLDVPTGAPPQQQRRASEDGAAARDGAVPRTFGRAAEAAAVREADGPRTAGEGRPPWTAAAPRPPWAQKAGSTAAHRPHTATAAPQEDDAAQSRKALRVRGWSAGAAPALGEAAAGGRGRGGGGEGEGGGRQEHRGGGGGGGGGGQYYRHGPDERTAHGARGWGEPPVSRGPNPNPNPNPVSLAMRQAAGGARDRPPGPPPGAPPPGRQRSDEPAAPRHAPDSASLGGERVEAAGREAGVVGPPPPPPRGPPPFAPGSPPRYARGAHARSGREDGGPEAGARQQPSQRAREGAWERGAERGAGPGAGRWTRAEPDQPLRRSRADPRDSDERGAGRGGRRGARGRGPAMPVGRGGGQGAQQPPPMRRGSPQRHRGIDGQLPHRAERLWASPPRASAAADDHAHKRMRKLSPRSSRGLGHGHG